MSEYLPVSETPGYYEGLSKEPLPVVIYIGKYKYVLHNVEWERSVKIVGGQIQGLRFVLYAGQDEKGDIYREEDVGKELIKELIKRNATS